MVGSPIVGSGIKGGGGFHAETQRAPRRVFLRLVLGPDAIVGDKGFRVGEIGRDARGGDGFVLLDALGDIEVEVEELLEEVFFGGEAVGG